KQIFRDSTARVRGTVYFRSRTGGSAQPMQGAKVVARWINPASGLPSHRYAAVSISGFLFRGNAGNPVSGFTDAGGERYDRFGSDDPKLEGYFDLAGLEFPDNGATAQYQITVEPVDPLCAEPASVGPYRSGQVGPSGTAEAIILMLNRGSELTRDFVMSGSALAARETAGTFNAPARFPNGGYWTGALSPYSNIDYYSLAARSNRTLTLKITALDDSRKPTQHKLQPVVGLWPGEALQNSAPDIYASYFNTGEPGVTVLNAQLAEDGEFRLGIADFRGDGRPDFRYRGRLFYADTVRPERIATQSHAALTIRGIGLDAATKARIGGQTEAVVAALPDRIILSTPRLSDGSYNIDLQAADGATSSLLNSLTYGAKSDDKILLLQGAANPATPVGGEAPNPLRVRVIEADGVTPVAGATVTLSASPAGVIFASCGTSTCALTTDEQGEAASRMVPSEVGAFTVTAAISPSALVRGTVTGTSSNRDIAAVAQSNWVAQGASGSLPLAVRVLSSGQPVGSATVQYRVTQGSATLSDQTGVTNSAGYASVNLNLSSVAAEVHASACVMPDQKPCTSFYVFAVPASALRLQYVTGEQQIINTAQSFAPVSLRVTDAASPSHPVQMAAVTVLTAVFRWQPPTTGGPNLPPPAPPVALSASQNVLYSDAAGQVSIVPSPAARFGAVLVEAIASAGSGTTLQFELQRLWAPPGWVAANAGNKPSTVYARPRRRLTSSPKYQPID
ncbi:MAG TPA: hypothetical protein VKT29_04190, partial [Terriglobales bacterium]|nr:hypothetical protein [Terriglobales bacterium]